jgi:hypothetical protein
MRIHWFGGLVFTSLTKEALPMIRYRTRDRTKLLPPAARSMRRLAKVMGRTDDMLIIRGVNVFPSQIEELIVGQPNVTPHYRLEVRRDGALDHLDVVVELEPHTANVASIREEAARDLQRRIKSFFGVTASVQVCNPGTVERSIGKAKRVIDRRGESLPPVAECDASGSRLSGWLEQLDGIAIGILDLDLLAARTGLHVVPDVEAGLLQGLDECWQIRHPKHDTIPSAGFLLLTVRHRPGSRGLWAAQQNLRVAERDAGKRG